jgi:hypothetical protein
VTDDFGGVHRGSGTGKVFEDSRSCGWNQNQTLAVEQAAEKSAFRNKKRTSGAKAPTANRTLVTRLKRALKEYSCGWDSKRPGAKAPSYATDLSWG